MSLFKYASGDEVRVGDRILYHYEPGQVEFIVAERSGDPTRDWYLDNFPGGGVMITTAAFGSVFLTGNDVDEDLELVSRSVS